MMRSRGLYLRSRRGAIACLIAWLLIALVGVACSLADSLKPAAFERALAEPPWHDRAIKPCTVDSFETTDSQLPVAPLPEPPPSPPFDLEGFPNSLGFWSSSEYGFTRGQPLLLESVWYDNVGCPESLPWYRIYEGSNFGLPCYHNDQVAAGFLIDGVVRGYYHNDQRVRWTGNEATLGGEGVISPRLVHHVGNWTVSANGVFFLNQPYDGNMLTDPSRAPYHGNYERYPFYLWNLNLAIAYEDWRVVFGKDATPFGRFYEPLQTNQRLDAPFIRTEIIGWNETGMFIHYQPDWLVADMAIVNGTQDLDTNSDKGVVARLGVRGDNFAAGVSGRKHDGIGSEHQKRNDNQFGFDALVVHGNWDLSAEAIYDEYGYRKAVFDPTAITWPQGIYYRDIYAGRIDGKLTGLGYYLNLGYTQPRYRLDLNFGEYYPRSIGNPLHDPANRRWILKSTVLMIPRVEALSTLIFESKRPVVEEFRSNYAPFAVCCGVQTYF